MSEEIENVLRLMRSPVGGTNRNLGLILLLALPKEELESTWANTRLGIEAEIAATWIKEKIRLKGRRCSGASLRFEDNCRHMACEVLEHMTPDNIGNCAFIISKLNELTEFIYRDTDYLVNSVLVSNILSQ